MKTDVARIAREVADDIAAPAAAAGLALYVRAPNILDAEADPVRLLQVLSNRLSNAVKYARGSRASIEAEVRRSGGPRAGDRVAVSVTDTGPGIPPEKQEAIFQEYTRLQPEAQQGAGLGLAISRRVARLPGGDVTVESEGGGGATFTLWLPAGASPP